MKQILTCTLAASVLITTACWAGSSPPDLRFNNAPLEVILDAYASHSGKRIEVVEGVEAKISLAVTNSVAAHEFLKLVETKLKENNIGLFPISEGRLVATWIDPDWAKPVATPEPGSYQERLELRKRMVEENKRRQRVVQHPPAN